MLDCYMLERHGYWSILLRVSCDSFRLQAERCKNGLAEAVDNLILAAILRGDQTIVQVVRPLNLTDTLLIIVNSFSLCQWLDERCHSCADH